MESDENKRLHLKMIEDTIARMSSNSFLIKGWSLTAIGGLTTLYIAKWQHSWAYYLIILAIIVCILFWFNDAYYLLQERRYRKLYDLVRKKDEQSIDFDMTTPECEETIWSCLLRPIFRWSYLLILIALIVLAIIMRP